MNEVASKIPILPMDLHRPRPPLPAEPAYTRDGTLPLLYEDDDEGDMGESNPHATTILILTMGIRAHLANRPALAVFFDMNLYYSDEDPKANVSPDGMVVAPARRGLWSRSDRTPFGQGQPYSMSQLTRLLRDSMFTPVTTARALYLPPIGSPTLLRWAPAWERLGRRWCPRFAGTLLIEAGKGIRGSLAEPFLWDIESETSADVPRSPIDTRRATRLLDVLVSRRGMELTRAQSRPVRQIYRNGVK